MTNNDRKLIVNADGFGFGPGATQGIIDAIREGHFISSVSVNANFPEVLRIRELATEFPNISIGVHLNPMVGRPCLSPELVPSLVGADGSFQNGDFLTLLRKGRISLKELEAEFDAQIRVTKDLVGDALTHLDSQENTHLHYFDLLLKLASKWQVRRIRNNASVICLESTRPRRSRLNVYLRSPHVGVAHLYRRQQMRKARSAGIRTADDLITVGYAGRGNKTNPDNWRRILENLPPGTHEIYCHPAYPDDTLQRWAYYCDERASELAILRRQELRELARKVDVEIISFHAV
jgi:chitin disaccharide deacetylase